jgi:hypothetical protein
MTHVTDPTVILNMLDFDVVCEFRPTIGRKCQKPARWWTMLKCCDRTVFICAKHRNSVATCRVCHVLLIKPGWRRI